MSFELIKIFIDCVHCRDLEGVELYISQISNDILKKMRLFANKKDYDEIVEVIDRELQNRS